MFTPTSGSILLDTGDSDWSVISGLGEDLRFALAGGRKKFDNFICEGFGDLADFLLSTFAFDELLTGEAPLLR